MLLLQKGVLWIGVSMFWKMISGWLWKILQVWGKGLKIADSECVAKMLNYLNQIDRNVFATSTCTHASVSIIPGFIQLFAVSIKQEWIVRKKRQESSQLESEAYVLPINKAIQVENTINAFALKTGFWIENDILLLGLIHQRKITSQESNYWHKTT